MYVLYMTAVWGGVGRHDAENCGENGQNDEAVREMVDVMPEPRRHRRDPVLLESQRWEALGDKLQLEVEERGLAVADADRGGHLRDHRVVGLC